MTEFILTRSESSRITRRGQGRFTITAVSPGDHKGLCKTVTRFNSNIKIAAERWSEIVSWVDDHREESDPPAHEILSKIGLTESVIDSMFGE